MRCCTIPPSPTTTPPAFLFCLSAWFLLLVLLCRLLLYPQVPSQRLSSTHDAVMHTFDKPTPCQYCNKLLKGLFYQGMSVIFFGHVFIVDSGYSCQKCCRPMHKECIPLLSKCGPNSAPPSLPPRPPSMQLPSPTGIFLVLLLLPSQYNIQLLMLLLPLYTSPSGGQDTLHRLSSTLSLAESEAACPPSLPLPPPLGPLSPPPSGRSLLLLLLPALPQTQTT